jgi:hypothetical protein
MLQNSSAVTELHPFTKAAMAYIGIMAGLALLGLVFYAVASTGEAEGSVPVPPAAYYQTILYLVSLTGLSLGALALLAKGMRAGAYVAFAALAISVLAPAGNQTLGNAFNIIYWFAIPNAAVGILLLKAIKTLH